MAKPRSRKAFDDVGPEPAADGVGGFEEEEVDAGLGSSSRRTDREAAADDDDVGLGLSPASTRDAALGAVVDPRWRGRCRCRASLSALESLLGGARHLRAERPDATALDLAVLDVRDGRRARGECRPRESAVVDAREFDDSCPASGRAARGRRTRPADGRGRREGGHGEGRCHVVGGV